MKKIIPELYSTGEKLIYYREKAPSLKSFDLNLRQTCDLDLLLDGSFNPLNGFLTKKGFKKVYPDSNNVPRPDNWSGWILEPTMLEFWLEGPNRIHERLRYFKEQKKWVKKLFNP